MARILRMPDLKEKVGLSKTTIYDLIAAGKFPASINLTAKSRGWLDNEVDDWLESLAHKRDDDARAI